MSRTACRAIGDRRNEVFVSGASAWEITTKIRLGKLPGIASIANTLGAEVEAEGFRLLPISFAHACLAGSLGHAHRDPFDRMLVAQALTEYVVLASNELLFDEFGVQRLW